MRDWALEPREWEVGGLDLESKGYALGLWALGFRV